MSPIREIVHGSELTTYFRQCLKEAMEHQEVSASEEAEFYLVNLLRDYCRARNLFDEKAGHIEEKTLAVLFAQAQTPKNKDRILILKNLGDLALFMAGFYADNIEQRKFVNLDYYIRMGGGAYFELSSIMRGHKMFEPLYHELSSEFAEFTQVLGEMSDKLHLQSNIDILRLYERWLNTRDERVREILISQGIHIDPKNIKDES